MTTKMKTRPVAELERELEKVRKEIALLNWMHWEAIFAASEMLHLRDDEKGQGRALFFSSYIRYLGWQYLPEKGFKELPRLPGIEEYLAEV